MQYIFAKCHAQSVADNLTAAYWTKNRGAETSDFLVGLAESAFKQLAAELGYRVEKIPADVATLAKEA